MFLLHATSCCSPCTGALAVQAERRGAGGGRRKTPFLNPPRIDRTEGRRDGHLLPLVLLLACPPAKAPADRKQRVFPFQDAQGSPASHTQAHAAAATAVMVTGTHLPAPPPLALARQCHRLLSSPFTERKEGRGKRSRAEDPRLLPVARSLAHLARQPGNRRARAGLPCLGAKKRCCLRHSPTGTAEGGTGAALLGNGNSGNVEGAPGGEERGRGGERASACGKYLSVCLSGSPSLCMYSPPL